MPASSTLDSLRTYMYRMVLKQIYIIRKSLWCVTYADPIIIRPPSRAAERLDTDLTYQQDY